MRCCMEAINIGTVSSINIPLTSLQALDQVGSQANQSQGHYGP